MIFTNMTIAITGSQSGMGLAIRKRLEESGCRIIGVDLPGKGAEVEADLSHVDGRRQAVTEVLKMCGHRLDGAVANAGVDTSDNGLMFEINFRGVVEWLEGLRPALVANSQSRVLITASNSVLITPGLSGAAAEALATGNTPEALRLISSSPTGYQVSKLAVLRWMRARAADWAKNGISLNAIAPGAVLTPLLEKDLADSIKGPLINALPRPIGVFPKPEDIAGLAAFLLSKDARFIIGQVITIDGGTEVSWRESDWPAVWHITSSEFMAKINLPKQSNTK